MYIGIDVGGTKTLVGVLDEHGAITERLKFPTPKNYDDFLQQLKTTLAGFSAHDFQAGAIAIPGRIDREHGRAVRLGNISTWGENIPVLDDVEALTKCPMALENDAKLGGLSEAMLLKDEFKKVLYVTVSTGIGIALVVNGVIDTNVGDGGGRAILIEHKDQQVPWEDVASGRQIVETYGLRAADITDPVVWQKICRQLAKGLIELIAITEPEVIVIGGSVGTYFERYGDILLAELEKYHVALVELPALRGAGRAEQAVVYGCYDLAKQRFPNA